MALGDGCLIPDSEIVLGVKVEDSYEPRGFGLNITNLD